MVIALISLGCPKNQVDADVMCHALLERGHTTTADLSEADAIILRLHRKRQAGGHRQHSGGLFL